MKKYFCFLVWIFLMVSLYGINTQNESIKAYRNALVSFDNMDYGTALKYSEEAILYRRQETEKQIEKLKKSLISKRVQAAGDNISDIVKVLESRNEKETIEIINVFTKVKGYDYFNNSMTTLLKYMNESMVYPEAHKLIADIYKLEGEYQFAEEYYSLALKNSDVLDIPDEKYEILYTLADISRLQNDYKKYEVRLLNILVNDKNFQNKILLESMNAIVKGNKSGCCEKFFTMFRADSYLQIEAYNKLAEYYYTKNEIEKALQFAELAAITSFTKISEIIESRNSEYKYVNLSTFFQEASFYSDIVDWGKENNIWKSFNILAKYSKDEGMNNFAGELLKVLIQFSPSKYWQKDAVLLLEVMN